MTGAIEVMARAICERNLWGAEPITGGDTPSERWLRKEVDRCWPDYQGQAKAAVKALAGAISDEMICAADEAIIQALDPSTLIADQKTPGEKAIAAALSAVGE